MPSFRKQLLGYYRQDVEEQFSTLESQHWERMNYKLKVYNDLMVKINGTSQEVQKSIEELGDFLDKESLFFQRVNEGIVETENIINTAQENARVADTSARKELKAKQDNLLRLQNLLANSRQELKQRLENIRSHVKSDE